MASTKRSFQAEVRTSNIVAHSLYSEREVFLRELISNAADACINLGIWPLRTTRWCLGILILVSKSV